MHGIQPLDAIRVVWALGIAAAMAVLWTRVVQDVGPMIAKTLIRLSGRIARWITAR